MSAFSKKTGDYGVLSSTDLKVLALTYELECQLGVEKGENLRTTPLNQVMCAIGLNPCCSGTPVVHTLTVHFVLVSISGVLL